MNMKLCVKLNYIFYIYALFIEDQRNISDKSFRFRHSSQPFFQNIFGSVMIPVVFRTAVRAYPGADAQIFCIFVLIAADGAELGRGEEGIHNGDILPVPGGLVLQLPSELIEGSVANGTRYMVVLHHAFGVQVLDTDNVILSHQVCGSFLNSVPPLISDAFFQFCLVESGLLSFFCCRAVSVKGFW